MANGLVTADTFDGLRALIAPSHKRPSFAPRRRRRRNTAPGVDAAGRWASLQTKTPPPDEHRRMTDLATLEHIAWVLLQRYGVVFRRVLDREQTLPPWRELLYVFRLLEARGEVHGGRFVDQFAGEQFAHPEAVGALARFRRAEPDGTLVAISAADPLNLIGIVTPGARVPASPGNRILLRDGAPVAVHIGGELRYLEAMSPEAQWDAHTRLVRRAG